jgi:1-aminocyclopropane-1-carboxylate deaminase/D-cysteine desulfhydrase-like pyridoxal-dependent ACC family enzyme
MFNSDRSTTEEEDLRYLVDNISYHNNSISEEEVRKLSLLVDTSTKFDALEIWFKPTDVAVSIKISKNKTRKLQFENPRKLVSGEPTIHNEEDN